MKKITEGSSPERDVSEHGYPATCTAYIHVYCSTAARFVEHITNLQTVDMISSSENRAQARSEANGRHVGHGT